MRWMRAIPSFDSCSIAVASNSTVRQRPRRAPSASGSSRTFSSMSRMCAGQRLDVGEHERRRVVDLVRDAGGEHADRRQLLGLQAAHLAVALLGRVADVEHHAPPDSG